jgi:hypothetical protein
MGSEMSRKPTIAYRIVCSGKGKPWHTDASNRAHTHNKRTPKAAEKDAAALNEQPNPTPIKAECLPWTIETRTITQWETWTPNSS